MNLTGFKVNTMALKPINGTNHMMKVAGWVQRLHQDVSTYPSHSDPPPVSPGATERAIPQKKMYAVWLACNSEVLQFENVLSCPVKRRQKFGIS